MATPIANLHHAWNLSGTSPEGILRGRHACNRCRPFSFPYLGNWPARPYCASISNAPDPYFGEKFSASLVWRVRKRFRGSSERSRPMKVFDQQAVSVSVPAAPWLVGPIRPLNAKIKRLPEGFKVVANDEGDQIYCALQSAGNNPHHRFLESAPIIRLRASFCAKFKLALTKVR